MSSIKTKASARELKERNKSAEVLQEFVDNLLTEADSSVSFDNIDQPVIGESQSSNARTISYSRASSLIKPLLSERLKMAQNLLKEMPVLGEKEKQKFLLPQSETPETLLEAEQKTLVKDLDLPQILTNPILPLFSTIIDQGIEDIEIVLEEEPASALKPLSPSPLVSNTDALSNEIQADGTLSEPINTFKKAVPKVYQKTYSGPPAWGKGEFQTLTFNIGELKLAVPLVKLGGIHRLHPEPTPMAGRPPWYMGLVADEFGNISLIDTALWIMPEKYEIAKAKGLDYEYIVLLDDTRWGLACSCVNDALTLTENEVKWTAKGSKRPWLAGMLVDQMCALLDVDVLIEMLDELAGESVH